MKKEKMHNEEGKKKKILAFLLDSDAAQSAYRIEKSTGIFWKDIPRLLDELKDAGKIRMVDTSGGKFYEVVVD